MNYQQTQITPQFYITKLSSASSMTQFRRWIGSSHNHSHIKSTQKRDAMTMYRFAWRQIWNLRYLLAPLIIFVLMRQLIIGKKIHSSVQELDSLELEWNEKLDKLSKIVEEDEQIFAKLVRAVGSIQSNTEDDVGSESVLEGTKVKGAERSPREVNGLIKSDSITPRKETNIKDVETLTGLTAMSNGRLKQQPQTVFEGNDILPNITGLQFEKEITSAQYELVINQRIPLFLTWWTDRKISCGNSFYGFQEEFSYLNNVILDPKQFVGDRDGGEPLEDVLGQPERYEYFTIQKGCFKMVCPSDDRPAYKFKDGIPHKMLMRSVTLAEPQDLQFDEVSHFTIAIIRYEYFNFYHTMTDWYNTYLLVRFFNQDPASVNILIMDAHPWNSLDKTWTYLFHRVIRVGHMSSQVHFRHLVWGMIGYNSPMLAFFTPELPYIEEFRSFFLDKFHLLTSERKLNCSEIHLLLVLRKPFLAHARHKADSYDSSRHLHNASATVSVIHNTYGGLVKVRAASLEDLTMKDQLHVVRNTDILMGMHGAAMTHTLFLPKHATLIEFFPRSMEIPYINFSNLAQWRNIHYLNWHNKNAKNEDSSGALNIPPLILQGIVDDAILAMCPEADIWGLNKANN